MSEEPTDPVLKAIEGVTTALNAVKDDPAHLHTVLTYINARFGGKIAASKQLTPEFPVATTQDGQRYKNIGDLFDAANPQSEPERVLVVAYWLQEIEKLEDFESFPLNKQLKHLGHPVSNITRSLEVLANETPRLVLQISKSGSSQQARKKYKITREGVKRVQQMLSKTIGGGHINGQ